MKKVCNVGVNDSSYEVTRYEVVKGKNIQVWMCPFYKTWKSMIVRCYNKKALAHRPTYQDCFVNEDWLHFSKFREWMETQDWKDKQLDKDLLVKGNKVYDEDCCCFIDKELNSFLTERQNDRGLYPIGVFLDKETGKFVSKVSDGSRIKFIGRFKTPDEAHLAWLHEKHKIAVKLSLKVEDVRVKLALQNRYKLITEEI